MITFKEFLVRFDEEIQEIFESGALTKNAQLAVVSVMRNRLKNMRFDPLELMELFETVCYSAMINGHYDKEQIKGRFRQVAPSILTREENYDFYPEITFEEVEERRANRR